jgi:hypothetical protein
MPYTTRGALFSLLVSGLLATLPATAADPPALAPDDLAAAFAAAGFQQAADGRWIRCQEDPPTMSYMPGQAEITDLNGDGQPEAWITESSLFCYGNTGSAFVLLTRGGMTWRPLLDEVGIPLQLEARHDGWPDIEVGGPGFGRFPVYRWNGHAYTLAK